MPIANGFIEPLNERLRDECLNVNEFSHVADVRAVLRPWQHDCNHHRPHGSLGRLTQSEFAMKGSEDGPRGTDTLVSSASKH